jgi:hypothetical protein
MRDFGTAPEALSAGQEGFGCAIPMRTWPALKFRSALADTGNTVAEPPSYDGAAALRDMWWPSGSVRPFPPRAAARCMPLEAAGLWQ